MTDTNKKAKPSESPATSGDSSSSVCSTISRVRSELTRIAANMLINDLPSDCVEDYRFAKTMPKIEQQRTVSNAAEFHEYLRLRAIEIRDLAKLLK